MTNSGSQPGPDKEHKPRRQTCQKRQKEYLERLHRNISRRSFSHQRYRRPRSCSPVPTTCYAMPVRTETGVRIDLTGFYLSYIEISRRHWPNSICAVNLTSKRAHRTASAPAPRPPLGGGIIYATTGEQPTPKAHSILARAAACSRPRLAINSHTRAPFEQGIVIPAAVASEATHRHRRARPTTTSSVNTIQAAGRSPAPRRSVSAFAWVAGADDCLQQINLWLATERRPSGSHDAPGATRRMRQRNTGGAQPRETLAGVPDAIQTGSVMMPYDGCQKTKGLDSSSHPARRHHPSLGVWRRGRQRRPLPLIRQLDDLSRRGSGLAIKNAPVRRPPDGGTWRTRLWAFRDGALTRTPKQTSTTARFQYTGR